MQDVITLCIDVGTGSARAALVAAGGRILAMAAREHDQIVPQFGWAEQRPADWWAGVVAAVRQVLAEVPDAAGRVRAVAACGQMHGTVLLDKDGHLTSETAALWNDKRSLALVQSFENSHAPQSYLAESGNPPTPAWPGFKLQWYRDYAPEAYARTRHMVMPKDYINLRLAGEIAMDSGDASCSFLMNPGTRQWSPKMLALLGLDAAILPPIREPMDILGQVTREAAAETGLRAGTPVLVGGADYPVSLLGSGACKPGMLSDVTGTSCILTLITRQPLLDPEISNVATIEGNWGPFVLLESGGDAMRWARRAFHEKSLGYDQIVAKAAEAPVGAGALFFLPFLTGQRLGQHRNARAQFFGLGAGHGLAHLHRAVMEGVAFAGVRHLHIMEHAAQQKVERVIASGGGAKTNLWLRIKASMYGVPIDVPQEPECGIIGCSIMATTALGHYADVNAAVQAHVRYAEPVLPEPAWSDVYRRMQPVFNQIYDSSRHTYDALDALLQPPLAQGNHNHVS
jgi:xylulokinase